MRKIATAALGFAGAILTAYYILPDSIYLPAAGVFAILSLTALRFHGNLRIRVLILCLSAAAGFIWCCIFTVFIDNRSVGAGSTEEISMIIQAPQYVAGLILNKVDELFPSDTAPFMKALLTGDRSDLNNDIANSSALSASGIIHVVAVSGMHISFLMGFLTLVIKNKKMLAIYAIPVLLFFMAMTGFTPGVSRAGIMQIFLLCAPLFNRESDSITSLSSAVILLLIINPGVCASVSMQLSFSATFGIILFSSRINNAVTDFMREMKINKRKILSAIIRYISSNLATTIGALVFTMPLCAVHFGYISLVSPLANLLTIGAVSLSFPLGLLAVILSYLSPVIAGIAAFPVTLAVRYITLIARMFAAVPFSVVYTGSTHIFIWLAYVYIMFTVLPLLKARFRQYLYPVCISIILLISIILIPLLFEQDKPDIITAVDVGQGQSIVITAGEYTMVVDCGSNSTRRAGELTHEYLQSIERSSIDFLILTHFHDDHINGVESLISRINVSVLVIPDPDGYYIAEDIIELARKNGTDIIYISQTYTFNANDTQVFLYPALGKGDENERGLAVLIMGNINALITGDMSATAERALLRFAHLPRLDLLVVGHHGSRFSTSEELLQALSPAIAVIPVGRNSFGHPHPDTIERLEKYNIQVYQTDKQGHITVTSDRHGTIYAQWK